LASRYLRRGQRDNLSVEQQTSIYYRQLESELAQLRSENAWLKKAQVTQEEQIEALRLQEKALRLQEKALIERNGEFKSRLSELQLQKQFSEQGLQEKIALLETVKERFTGEFESLANRIFDAKQQHYREDSQQSLLSSLSPLKLQLSEFKQKIEYIHDSESRDRAVLLRELDSLKSLNEKMSSDAINLTNALKGENKVLGNWGELVLERVLEDSGLRKGIEYETQLSFRDQHGRRRQPDVLIHLPEGRDIVVDAKASLVAYERYCSSDNKHEREKAGAEHISALRRHVKELSGKSYEQLEGLRTLDFVFIFIPIESAFLLAMELDSRLFTDAYQANIVIVSPGTLLASLRTVASVWRQENQSKNAEKIAALAGGLHDQFILVLESIEEASRCMAKSRQALDTTISRISNGKGNLIKRVNDLEKLGARTKRQIPESYTDQNLPVDGG
jgi:DNA recombination protein RmuC